MARLCTFGCFHGVRTIGVFRWTALYGTGFQYRVSVGRIYFPVTLNSTKDSFSQKGL